MHRAIDRDPARKEDEHVNPERRATLAGLADELIPAADGMPSASQAGVAGLLLDEVIRLRADLEAPLAGVLDRTAGREPEASIAELQGDDPEGFAVLTEVVAGGYFLSHEVRERIGYSGQQALPIQLGEPPDYEQDGLLASVVARGPIYRPTPHPPEQ
jgi:hypothetical protein